ncbi:MAG: 2,5-diamino-6-(ribosylamino)-4(3H)-pyrimidinone 5'-phosphate reductase [Candidatus Hadarchaeales archaeon]
MLRPFVVLNMAMSVDGKIATVEGDSKLSCREDLRRLHLLRSKVDAVMVGIGTVLKDNPSLTVRLVKGRNPIRVVVDSSASIPLHARVLDGSAPVVLAVSRKAQKEKVRRLEQKGVRVVVAGRDSVDLPQLLEKLYKLGIRKLLLEGGSTLNWSMLKNRLVDELRITVCPVILGGERAKSLVGGEGFRKVRNGLWLRLIRVERVGEGLLLIYRPR